MSDKAYELVSRLISESKSFERNFEPDQHTRLLDARDAILDYIAELQESCKWIRVGERLPEFGTSILFYDSILEKTNKGACMALDGDKNRIQWSTDDGLFYYGERCEYITHWKPLPEPPEVQE